MLIENDKRVELMYERVKVYKTGDLVIDKNYIVGVYEDDLENIVIDCRYIKFSHLVKILDIPYRTFYKLVEKHILKGVRVYGTIFIDCRFMEVFLYEHDEYSEDQYFAFLNDIDDVEETVYGYYTTDRDHGQFIDSDILSQVSQPL